jgi:hypothetical protein
MVIQTARRELRSAPPFSEKTAIGWQTRVEDALVGFVTSNHVKRLVIARVNRANGVAIPRHHELRSLGHLSNDSRDNIDTERTVNDLEQRSQSEDQSRDRPPAKVISFATISGKAHRASKGDASELVFNADTDLNAEEIDPDREGGCRWIEDRALILKLHQALRRRLADNLKYDRSILQIFDQLTNDAKSFDAWAHYVTGLPDYEDVFRGESNQVVAVRLLASLQKNYPKEKWTMQRVRTAFAKLCRTMRSWLAEDEKMDGP